MSKKWIEHDIIQDWWWDVLYAWSTEMKETQDEYEYKHLRVCEKWLQRANCSKCLFEVLCHYKRMNDENRRTENPGG